MKPKYKKGDLVDTINYRLTIDEVIPIKGKGIIGRMKIVGYKYNCKKHNNTFITCLEEELVEADLTPLSIKEIMYKYGRKNS